MKLGFGRILDASSAGDTGDDQPTRRNVAVPATRLARVLAPPVVTAHDEARAIRLRAEQHAAQVLTLARAEAASLQAHAAEEGRAEAAAELAARSVVLAEKERSLDERGLDRLVDLAGLLAERLLGEALRLEPSRVNALARQALTEAQGARRIEIAAHPDDAPLLERELELAGAEAAVRVVPDPSRERGSLRFDTELGSLDADLRPQLARLVKKLRATLAHG